MRTFQSSVMVPALLCGALLLAMVCVGTARAAEPAFTNDPIGEEARKVWEKAQTGNLEAQTGMAMLYWGGIGVPKDPCKALSLARKAGRKGYGTAQAMVVMLYLVRSCGEHDDERFVRAYAWFTDEALEVMVKNDMGKNLGIGPDNELDITSISGFRNYLGKQLSRSDIKRAMRWREKLDEGK